MRAQTGSLERIHGLEEKWKPGGIEVKVNRHRNSRSVLRIGLRDPAQTFGRRIVFREVYASQNVVSCLFCKLLLQAALGLRSLFFLPLHFLLALQERGGGWHGKASKTKLLRVLPFNWILSPAT